MKVNGHKILSKEGNKYYIMCGMCGSYTFKNKANLYKNSHCENCKTYKGFVYAGRTISQWCWILGLKETTIKSRMYRGWSIKEALFQKKKVFDEIFAYDDLEYLSNFNTTNYLDNLKIDKNAFMKYKQNKFKT